MQTGKGCWPAGGRVLGRFGEIVKMEQSVLTRGRGQGDAGTTLAYLGGRDAKGDVRCVVAGETA